MRLVTAVVVFALACLGAITVIVWNPGDEDLDHLETISVTTGGWGSESELEVIGFVEAEEILSGIGQRTTYPSALTVREQATEVLEASELAGHALIYGDYVDLMDCRWIALFELPDDSGAFLVEIAGLEGPEDGGCHVTEVTFDSEHFQDALEAR